MRRRRNPSGAGEGWGPFTSRQLTTIVCVAIVAAVAIPTAAMAAVGAFTSTTVTPAVSATNSAANGNAKAVFANQTGGGLNTRYGVYAAANGPAGIGAWGSGAKYGVFSNGPLGVAAGKPLSCTGCVHAAALAPGVGTTLAYAEVSPSVVLVQARNFSGVTRPSTGAYCLAPSGGVSPATSPITQVTVEWSHSASNSLAAYAVDSAGDCPAGNYEVRTFDFAGAPTNNVAFEVVIPG